MYGVLVLRCSDGCVAAFCDGRLRREWQEQDNDHAETLKHDGLILRQFWMPSSCDATPVRLHDSEAFSCHKDKNGITAFLLITINV